jgi:hypothetical protein
MTSLGGNSVRAVNGRAVENDLEKIKFFRVESRAAFHHCGIAFGISNSNSNFIESRTTNENKLGKEQKELKG